MRIVMVWPIGPLHPGTALEVVDEVGAVLCREGFANPAEGPPLEPAPEPPTVAELKAYAATNGLTILTARDRLAAELAARGKGPGHTTPDERPGP